MFKYPLFHLSPLVTLLYVCVCVCTHIYYLYTYSFHLNTKQYFIHFGGESYQQTCLLKLFSCFIKVIALKYINGSIYICKMYPIYVS